jgi:hypothetical protein
MKTKGKPRAADELRSEYQLDYSRSRHNRFAGKMADAVAVVLEPDVARIFSDSASVNSFLRSVISAIPKVQSAESPIGARNGAANKRIIRALKP